VEEINPDAIETEAQADVIIEAAEKAGDSKAATKAREAKDKAKRKQMGVDLKVERELHNFLAASTTDTPWDRWARLSIVHRYMRSLTWRQELEVWKRWAAQLTDERRRELGYTDELAERVCRIKFRDI
jgi:hypothetical protein